MTILLKKKAKIFRRIPFFSLAILFFMLFFLRNAALAKDAVLAGLRRSALGVLPSVFPFLVFSGLLTSSGGLPSCMSRWLARLLRLSPSAAAAILLGWLCGFPVGAVYAAAEVERGRIPETEITRVVAAASVPSPAFLIGVVGNGIFGNAGTGIALWGGCVFSALIVCAATGKKEEKKKIPLKKTTPSPAEPFFQSLTSAVGSAALTALNLCAFITFFSVLIATIQSVLLRFGAPSSASAFPALLLELSNGILSAAALPEAARLPFCAAACGWAGLSVHFQIFSVCKNMNLKYGSYLLAKGLQALIALILIGLLSLLRERGAFN